MSQTLSPGPTDVIVTVRTKCLWTELKCCTQLMPSLFSTFSHIQTLTISLDELSISRKDPNSETVHFFLWGDPDCKTDADHFNANLLAGQSYVSILQNTQMCKVLCFCWRLTSCHFHTIVAASSWLQNRHAALVPTRVCTCVVLCRIRNMWHSVTISLILWCDTFLIT